MNEFLMREIADVRITLRSVVLPQPKRDPGYDMFERAYVVEVRPLDDRWGDEFTYSDYASALSVFNREIEYQAVAVARRAMRRAA